MKYTLPRDRQRVLERCRHRKMARSVQAYVRGSVDRFYEWLASSRVKRPVGPHIWICGDCHVGNLGPLAGTAGEVEIGVRDFDQSVIGNPAHDLIRLALSLATAARGSDLPGLITAHMMEAIMVGYQMGVEHLGRRRPALGEAGPVRVVLREALKRKWRDLAKDRISDPSPEIPLGRCFWPLQAQERAALRELFASKPVRELVTCLRQGKPDDRVEIVDAAYWRKGCSSLGRLRFAVLARVEDQAEEVRHCLLDIKEASPAVAPHPGRAGMPRNPAERVILAARNLSPTLGERSLAATMCGRPVFVRELRPQDMKVELGKLHRHEAVATARYLSEVLGKAHGRQMTAANRQRWVRELRRNRSRRLDVPSWLWSTVVELLGIHELAYLEHCRRYALQESVRKR
ncbi:MAG: DUF2252 family protein [Gammaproteobacteria bacterium]|nr:DUF2252 family protein [Gammaproteobacteria bacterium]